MWMRSTSERLPSGCLPLGLAQAGMGPEAGFRGALALHFGRRRRYVCPRDPRTPAQLRVRQTFGAASKTWSSPGLSPQERQEVRAAAKKVQSRPRLRQSGHLFGQQYFVQQACLKKGKAQG